MESERRGTNAQLETNENEYQQNDIMQMLN